jgi:hypothetical protein
MQAFAYVPEGAAIVIRSFQDGAFVFSKWFAVAGGQVDEP